MPLRWAAAAATMLGIATAVFAVRAGVMGTPADDHAPALGAVTAPGWEHPITGQFQRHAMNALLVPLLDDHESPRWTNVALKFFCGPATRVEIDGQPLVPGAPIPTTAFAVRWYIDQCWPLDYAAFALSGVVDLMVYHEDTGLSATVSAQRLRIATSKGAASVTAPFAASMELDGREPTLAP